MLVLETGTCEDLGEIDNNLELSIISLPEYMGDIK